MPFHAVPSHLILSHLIPSHPIPFHLIPSHPIPSNLRLNPPQSVPTNPLQSPSILLNPTFPLLLLLLPLLPPSQSIKYKSSNMYVHTIYPTLPNPTQPYSHPKKKRHNQPLYLCLLLIFLPRNSHSHPINQTHFTSSYLLVPTKTQPRPISP